MQTKQYLIKALVTIIGLSLGGGIFYLCYLATNSMSYEYLQPIATVMLFVLLITSYGNIRSKQRELKTNKS